MENREIPAPVPLLLDPDLTASAKVLWLARQLNPEARPAELAARTGLSRQTLVRSLPQVTLPRRYSGARQAKVPSSLLADRKVGAQAKVLYGLLQAIPQYRWRQGEFSYATLSSQAHLSRNTLKQAIAELVNAGWVELSQKSARSPVQFRLVDPLLPRSIEAVDVVDRRLKRNEHRGEAIMQEYLSLLIDSDQFTDHARPGFLVNPLTQERMEFDRFYLPNYAFEFHGAQHDYPTERFSQVEVDSQQVRDLLKAGLCFYREIHLVVIRSADLKLEKMSERIPAGLPRRSLAGQEALIELLEEASFEYRAAGAGKGWTKRAPAGSGSSS